LNTIGKVEGVTSHNTFGAHGLISWPCPWCL